MTSPSIRPLMPYDFDQWRGLYQGYADFYRVALTKDGVQTKWSWLIDDGHVCIGLVAKQQSQLVGFANFRSMPSPLRGQIIRFLDDLFVAFDHRSGGAVAALTIVVQAAAKAQGWGVVRWITRDHNYWARGLYDKLAEKTDWVLYEKTEMVAK